MESVDVLCRVLLERQHARVLHTCASSMSLALYGCAAHSAWTSLLQCSALSHCDTVRFASILIETCLATEHSPWARLGRRFSRQNIIAAISTLTAFALLVALIARHAPPQHEADSGQYGTTAPEGKAASCSPPYAALQLQAAFCSSTCHWRCSFETCPANCSLAAAISNILFTSRGAAPSDHRMSSRVGLRLIAQWHAAGIIEASFQSSHDWRGRPRMVTGSSGAVSADHGRCSDMGAPPNRHRASVASQGCTRYWLQ